MEAGARVAGSRFAYLKGDLVLLELALVRWALELLRGEGFEPVVPPVLVREEALFGTGFLPDTEQQIYRLADDALYLAGTSEVALASLHAGEMLDGERAAAALRRLLALLPPRGRRRRARHARHLPRAPVRQGRDVHVRRRPRTRVDEHERLLAIEEEILQALEIPYRVVNIAVDDLGASAAKKYDCEAWLPGQQRYRELTSTSNTTDFQARRLDIRYRPDGGEPRHVATLNGTAVAVGADADRAARERPARGRHGRACPEVLHRVGCAADAAGRRPGMTETPITPDDPDIPDDAAARPTTASPRSTTSRSARRPSCPRRTRRCPASPSASRPRPTSGGLATATAGKALVRGSPAPEGSGVLYSQGEEREA